MFPWRCPYGPAKGSSSTPFNPAECFLLLRPLSSLQVINHRLQEYACRTSHQKQACFYNAAFALVLTLAACSWHKMNAVWRGEAKMSCVGMKAATRCWWMGIIILMTVIQCPSLNLATVVLLDRLRYIMSRLFHRDTDTLPAQLCWCALWWLLCQQEIITCTMFDGFGCTLCTYAFRILWLIKELCCYDKKETSGTRRQKRRKQTTQALYIFTSASRHGQKVKLP